MSHSNATDCGGFSDNSGTFNFFPQCYIMFSPTVVVPSNVSLSEEFTYAAMLLFLPPSKDMPVRYSLK